MKKSFLLVILFVFSYSQANTRPIIGVYTEPSDNSVYPSTNYSIIAASYVKFIEMAGAQAVPIYYDATQQYLDNLFSKINGLIFPGGAVAFTLKESVDSIFLRNAAYLIQKAKNATDNGDFFLVWGTCLGFELITYIESGYDKKILKTGYNDTGSHPIFDIDQSSKLFQNMPDDILEHITTYPSTYYHHSKGIQVEAFSANKILSQNYKYTSQSQSAKNVSFISSIESYNYPIFGIQFHPEKNMFEWKVDAPHDNQSIQVAQYFSNFFVNLTRQNQHSFNSTEEENKYLIYNQPVHSLRKSEFTELYILKNFGNPEVNYSEAYVPKSKNKTKKASFLESIFSELRAY